MHNLLTIFLWTAIIYPVHGLSESKGTCPLRVQLARLRSVPHGTTVFGIPFGMRVGFGRSPFIIMLGAPLADGPVETSVERQLHSQLSAVTRTDHKIFPFCSMRFMKYLLLSLRPTSNLLFAYNFAKSEHARAKNNRGVYNPYMKPQTINPIPNTMLPIFYMSCLRANPQVTNILCVSCVFN